VKILRLIFKKDWQVLSKLKIEADSQKLFKEVSNDYYFYTLISANNKSVGNYYRKEYNYE